VLVKETVCEATAAADPLETVWTCSSAIGPSGQQLGN
jgi:hypothetical protein